MDFQLSFATVGEPNPERTAFVLHGALGAGHNFRSFARRLHGLRPDWQFVLVDLRHHGSSQGAPPPHTLAACAADLQVLGRHLGVSPRVVIGHSFGGKVGLQYAEAASGLQQLWVLDSNPGAQQATEDHEVVRVLSALRAVPTPAASRADVISALMARGLSSGLSNWVTGNLTRTSRGYEWQLDFGALEALMADYFSVDLWWLLEQGRPGLDVHVVVAERSDRISPDLRARLENIPAQAQLTCHVLPNSGHWVHVDNPDALAELFDRHLPHR